MPLRGSTVRKQAITQRNFSLGEVREGFLEADDLEIRQASCRKAENVRVTATRSLKARPGSQWVSSFTDAYDLLEIRPQSGLVFGLAIRETSFSLIDSNGGQVFHMPSVPWAAASDVWVEPFRNQTVIGGPFGLYELVYNAGVWSFQQFVFDEAAGGELAQPYWAFEDSITVRPTARTGVVTLTASSAIWTAQYVGQRVRYGQREIQITGYVSPTVLNGTVTSILPPSFRLRMSSTVGFRTGDAVVGQDTNFQGSISAISGAYLDVITTDFFDGPDINEILSAPSGTGTVLEKVEISPLASFFWDEPLMSPARGYPRSGTSAAERLTLVDFPLVPDLICMSSTRGIRDFKAGADDDDAIIRTSGDNAPRFLHVVNAGDVLLFSDRGLYYIDVRNNGLLTPATFKAIPFDKRACSPVRPVAVDDGVVFVEASGQAIAACLLDGNIYLKWSVRTISNYHDQLIKTPIKLCGPSLFAEATEKYLFVVNNDGTMAAVSWFSDFSADSVGFIPWTTQGAYRSISPIFAGYWAIVDREIDGSTARFLEKFDNNMLLDASVPILTTEFLTANGVPLTANGVPIEVQTPNGTPLKNQEVAIYGGGWYGGLRTVGADGSIPDIEDMPEGSYAGFNFTARVQPWPVQVIESPRSGMLAVRVLRGSVSLLASGPFSVRSNRSTREMGGYAVNEDLSLPPPLRTLVSKFSVVGRRDHPEIEIIKDTPSFIEILAITQEVQV